MTMPSKWRLLLATANKGRHLLTGVWCSGGYHEFRYFPDLPEWLYVYGHEAELGEAKLGFSRHSLLDSRGWINVVDQREELLQYLRDTFTLNALTGKLQPRCFVILARLLGRKMTANLSDFSWVTQTDDSLFGCEGIPDWVFGNDK